MYTTHNAVDMCSVVSLYNFIHNCLNILDNGRRRPEHVADKLYKIRGNSLKNCAVSVLVYVT